MGSGPGRIPYLVLHISSSICRSFNGDSPEAYGLESEIIVSWSESQNKIYILEVRQDEMISSLTTGSKYNWTAITGANPFISVKMNTRMMKSEVSTRAAGRNPTLSFFQEAYGVRRTLGPGSGSASLTGTTSRNTWTWPMYSKANRAGRAGW